jgi:hypothetical protein
MRRQRLAADVIAGKPIAEAARDEGVSRTWASREANSTETKIIISELLDEHRGKVKALIPVMLEAIRGGLHALDGKKPDHRVRLIAAKRVIEIATAGRRVEETDTTERTITYEQLEELYRSKTA